MADLEEKVIPEAEEAKEETAAPAEEAKAEEAAPAEEKKEKKEKKEKAPKAKKKGGAVAVIVIALVLVLAAGGAALFAFLSGNQAVEAYKKKKYEDAYEKSKFAFFLNAADKDCIDFAYVSEVLYPEGNIYQAAEIADTIEMEEAKARLDENCPHLKLCKEGQIATFGKYETDATAENGQEALEWVVMDISETGGRKVALLVTKDIVGTPGGWNRSGSNTKYSESNLNEWCSTFYSELTMSDAALDAMVFKIGVKTGDDSVNAKAFAPSKEELEQYLTGDLAQYLNATSTIAAEGSLVDNSTAGGSAEGEEGEDLEEGAVGEEEQAPKIVSYYVRNASADGIGGFTNGAYVNNLSATDKTIGTRVCINVNLGEAK